MTDKMQITIIGLGLIGASAGLALRRYADRVTVVGHDRDPSVAGRAKSLGAVERTEWNLINAVARADRVLLTVPLGEIEETLKIIGPELRPGCLVVDTADLKAPVLRWAREFLPESVSLVGGHPIILADVFEAADARADLFTGKLFCLTPPARASDDAVRLAADLVEALGARPFFVDVTEHDGMAAAVEHLPALMATALLEMTSRSSGWGDMRKLASGHFYAATLPATGDAASVVRSARANREHVAHWLDVMINELSAWRDWLAGDAEDEKLIKDLESGLAAREAWLKAEASGDWEQVGPRPEIPGMGQTFGQMFGLGGLRRPQQPKGKR